MKQKWWQILRQKCLLQSQGKVQLYNMMSTYTKKI
jgi:hypothetical protein